MKTDVFPTFSSTHANTTVPSFPRKRESIFALAVKQMDSRFRENDGRGILKVLRNVGSLLIPLESANEKHGETQP
jgi:hypothetical protein